MAARNRAAVRIPAQFRHACSATPRHRLVSSGTGRPVVYRRCIRLGKLERFRGTMEPPLNILA
jgi:hypothetical protein